jgi:spore coat polysaccharide biosynthesis protein SpsF
VKVVAVVQARFGSSRLPGKVLLPLGGAPLLERMLERVRAARELDEVVVATTVDPRDQPVRQLAARLGVPVVSGHPTDLLERHLQAVAGRGADVVAKIPSDCPLIDPRVIDRVVRFYRRNAERFDFVSNLHPATYPDGNDVELMPRALLELAGREARLPHEREHTTPFFWDQPERFRIGNVAWESGRDLSMTHRLTIDYPDDHALIAAVYEALYRPEGPPFSLEQILAYLEAHPEVFALNQRYAGVNWYRHHLDQLRTVGRDQTVVLEEKR